MAAGRKERHIIQIMYIFLATILVNFNNELLPYCNMDMIFLFIKDSFQFFWFLFCVFFPLDTV